MTIYIFPCQHLLIPALTLIYKHHNYFFNMTMSNLTIDSRIHLETEGPMTLLCLKSTLKIVFIPGPAV